MLILDNARFHARDLLRGLCEFAGVLCIFLPPYSPDFNPIELLFGNIKARLRRNPEAARQNPIREITGAVMAVPPQYFRGWIRHCGYG